MKSFKLKNPRKGTETSLGEGLSGIKKVASFQIKESPEGDWNSKRAEFCIPIGFQIKESPEGDWNSPYTTILP